MLIPTPVRDLRFGFLWTLSLVGVSVQAQTLPDAGRILQETRPSLESAPAATMPPIQAPAQRPPAAPGAGDEVRVQVSQFEFSGNLALATDVLRNAVAAWSGRSLNFGELIQAVEAVEARYKEAGYFLAQAYLPPQKIKDGTIEIAVSEGWLGETRLEGESLVAPDVLYGYLDRLPKADALTLPLLERQILLINELAGGSATLDLQAGEKPGTTDVVLALKPEGMLGGRIEANNHGLPSTGEKRYSVTVNANSPFGMGERISLNALTSENRGLTSYNLRGDFPVGNDGWRVMAAASHAEYSLGGTFTSLQVSGGADSLRFGVAYPLIRSRAVSLKLQLEADDNALADRFRATDTTLDKRSRGFTATASGEWLDDFMGGGATRAEFALRTGTFVLGPTASAQDAPPSGLGVAGRFDKITLSAQRQQMLARDLSLQAQILQQLAGKNLDSSEKLTLGGPSTMPGYANGEASGDSGTLIRAALRWQAMPDVALTAFMDSGTLRLVEKPISLTNHRRLTDAGVSADWRIGGGFSASAILAWAGKSAPNAADNDLPRFWFSLGYAW